MLKLEIIHEDRLLEWVKEHGSARIEAVSRLGSAGYEFSLAVFYRDSND